MVIVLDDPKIGWKLNLSHVLRSSCIARSGRDGPAAYRRMARELGIRGLRQQDGSYRRLEEMAAGAAAFELQQEGRGSE